MKGIIGDNDGNEWINAYSAKVKELQQKALDNPNDKKIENELEREKELEAIVDSHIKTLMDNDISLYNYVENLQVKTKEGNKNVKVTVAVQELDFDVEWGAKTTYENTGEMVGYDNLEGYYAGGIGPVDKNGEIGFDILLNGKTKNRDNTLANEVGDVMFRMEYPKAAKDSGSDKGKSDEEYRAKGTAGYYSDIVQALYKARKKDGSGKDPEINPYPLKNE